MPLRLLNTSAGLPQASEELFVTEPIGTDLGPLSAVSGAPDLQSLFVPYECKEGLS